MPRPRRALLAVAAAALVAAAAAERNAPGFRQGRGVSGGGRVSAAAGAGGGVPGEEEEVLASKIEVAQGGAAPWSKRDRGLATAQGGGGAAAKDQQRRPLPRAPGQALALDEERSKRERPPEVSKIWRSKRQRFHGEFTGYGPFFPLEVIKQAAASDAADLAAERADRLWRAAREVDDRLSASSRASGGSSRVSLEGRNLGVSGFGFDLADAEDALSATSGLTAFSGSQGDRHVHVRSAGGLDAERAGFPFAAAFGPFGAFGAFGRRILADEGPEVELRGGASLGGGGAEGSSFAGAPALASRDGDGDRGADEDDMFLDDLSEVDEDMLDDLDTPGPDFDGQRDDAHAEEEQEEQEEQEERHVRFAESDEVLESEAPTPEGRGELCTEHRLREFLEMVKKLGEHYQRGLDADQLTHLLEQCRWLQRTGAQCRALSTAFMRMPSAMEATLIHGLSLQLHSSAGVCISMIDLR